MKKLYIAIIFITCVLVSFLITRIVLNKSSEPKTEVTTLTPTKKIVSETKVTQPVDKSSNQPVDKPSTQSNDTLMVQPDNPKKTQSDVEKKLLSSDIKEPQPAKEKTHVKISLSEIKQLILKGTYERDRRISKKYRIEYVDVSDDDMGELQQNFTFVQERVEFETWRDFEVVGIDYDEKGLVDCVKIRPIY